MIFYLFCITQCYHNSACNIGNLQLGVNNSYVIMWFWNGSLYFPALGPLLGPQSLALAPNLYFPVLAPNLCSLALAPNLLLPALVPSSCLLALAPNLYLPALAPGLYLPALTENLHLLTWSLNCIYQSWSWLWLPICICKSTSRFYYCYHSY